MSRTRRTVQSSIDEMRATQDELLDRLMAADGPV
jgi:hypothetical protein